MKKCLDDLKRLLQKTNDQLAYEILFFFFTVLYCPFFIYVHVFRI